MVHNVLYSNSLSNATLNNAVLESTRISIGYRKIWATVFLAYSLSNADFGTFNQRCTRKNQHCSRKCTIFTLQFTSLNSADLSYTVIFSARETALFKELLYQLHFICSCIVSSPCNATAYYILLFVICDRIGKSKYESLGDLPKYSFHHNRCHLAQMFLGCYRQQTANMAITEIF